MPDGAHRLRLLSGHVLAPCACAEAPPGAGELVTYTKGKQYGILADYEHPTRYSEFGINSEAQKGPETWCEMLRLGAERFPNEVCLAVERPLPQPEAPGVAPSLPWKDWKKWTYAQYYKDACNAAKAYITLGLEAFGSVAIFGFNAPEWLIAGMGAVLAGAKFAGIYGTDTPDQVQYKISHSGACIVVVDAQMEFERVAAKIEELPGVKVIVAWGMKSPGDLTRKDGSVCKVMTWDDLLALGEQQGSEAALQARVGAQRRGHCLSLIYTSGTTGFPKAVMVCHEGYFSIARGCMPDLLPVIDPVANRGLSYLPLSHVAGSLFDIFLPMYMAAMHGLKCTCYFARPYDLKEMTLALRIQFTEPTIFFAVPRVFEKIQERMMAVAATITGVKKKIATWAKGKGLEYCRNQQAGGSGAKPFLHGLADKLVLSKAREALGLHKCRFFLTGAAPISIETLEYFGALGMNIINAFGMSESSGATALGTVSRNKFGTCGPRMSGVEVCCFRTGPNGEMVEAERSVPGTPLKEEQQGEICFRGRHVMMGYLANPLLGEAHVAEIEKKTAETIDDMGWLHSGDKGTFDVDGYLKITGRYKELIIGAGGENIAPVPVETELKRLCPAISNVMMVGDQRKYNVCLISLVAEGATGEFPGTDALAGTALTVNPKVKTISEAIKDPIWQQYIQKGIEQTNSNTMVCQNNSWKIQKFAILPRDFSIETGEFTPTLKLKRSVAEEMWKELIETMF